MTIIERIVYLLESQGKQLKELAQLLNTHGGTISNWKKRNVDPPAKYIPTIAKFLEVSPLFLLTGSDPLPIRLSYEERDVLERYNSLDAEGKAIVKATLVKEKRRMESESKDITKYKVLR
ncbi:helix-turn-helix domain-containing protein [Veillonella magna]|uniref:Helix-turn-helix domain-containing protein n=1 Tax=Veillonella magna TaxID=464322 RepID=A0ABS2GEJ9_9FIRM|nr:helix-turn-helix domain-containing protein [Veillonella magna]MBM6823524.1 helix-turn-helix domain-containing protein [Veillonella magna]MBM6911868.1 helix-turn-helix domain-containing protein [Veillonella magna]